MTTLRVTPAPSVGNSSEAEAAYSEEVKDNIVALWARTACWLDNVAGTNAITANANPVLTAAPSKPMAFWLLPVNDCTAAVVVNIDGFGAFNVVRQDGTATTLGDIRAAKLQLLVFDGTSLRMVTQSNTVPLLLTTLTAAVSASLQDTTHLTSTFTEYELRFRNILPASANQPLELLVHSGGVFQTTNYLCSQSGADGGTGWDSAGTTTYIGVTRTATTFPANSGSGVSGWIRVVNPTNTSAPKQWFGQFTYYNGTTCTVVDVSGFWNGGNGAVDGFQVKPVSGNITSGSIEVWGIP